MMFAINAAERKAPEDMAGKSNHEIWKETIALMEESLVKVSEEDKAAYEQKIRQKMKAGKKLSSDELNYLRLNQPEMYRTALRVENSRQQLRIQLKKCKSKEEVDNVASIQNELLKAMEGDPDREYMAAMVRHEIDTFKKSNVYARLPEQAKDGKKKKQQVSDKEIWKDEDEGRISFNKMTVLTQMQIQCDKISELSEPFVA